MKLLNILLTSLLLTTPSFAGEWDEDQKESKKSEDIKLEECKPIVMNFIQPMDDGSEISGSTVMLCNGAYYSLQDTTTVHMLTERNDQVCYADYSCGNLAAWEGYFSIAGESFYGALGEFLDGPAQEIMRNYGYYGAEAFELPNVKVGATLSVGRGIFERSCQEISDKVCFTK